MHSITDRRTDRQTDGRQYYANSRSNRVAVRSAKKFNHVSILTYLFFLPFMTLFILKADS